MQCYSFQNSKCDVRILRVFLLFVEIQSIFQRCMVCCSFRLIFEKNSIVIFFFNVISLKFEQTQNQCRVKHICWFVLTVASQQLSCSTSKSGRHLYLSWGSVRCVKWYWYISCWNSTNVFVFNYVFFFFIAI